MSLAAGRLNKRVRLWEPAPPLRASDSGASIPQWTNRGDRWAAIDPVSVRDFIAADARQIQLTARIVMRLPCDVAGGWRVEHLKTGRDYRIIGALPDAESGQEYVTLAAGEGVVSPEA